MDSSFQIPLGGNTYQTAGIEKEEIAKEGILSWENQDSEFSVYFKSSQATQVSVLLKLIPQSQGSTIELVADRVFEIDIEPGQSEVNLENVILKKGYNEFQLKGISKEGSDFAKISDLEIHSIASIELEYVKDNENNRFYWGRRGPSVHLTYTLPDDQNFKWFYNEIEVPVGEDPIGSYFMANGFGEGYFGIQVNSEQERRILFSVWSPYKTDNPNEIPEEEKIKLLKKGGQVYTGEFGNEGSGGQSYLKYPWKAGVTYSFLNSVEPDGKGNTVYTAYFLDPEKGEWQLIASFSRPKTDTWYKRPHSFLENFIPESGNITRRGIYKNQWAADKEGNWIELTEAKFTGDDIARRGYRKDFAGGSFEDQFYLMNGVFFDESTEINSIFIRPELGNTPNIDWFKLP
ncbi:DUF3472 domain-containing protein [Algoriphagus zhangzhouensis]|uniref:DUF5077 domain-containing protein n=1 Tax=Algoriphagus zhangzhouensis TaxID=1073327 RepID=A0A1M7ZHY4_9BACT|nr:DUF3472 domain-containing protein [Algoriphagus zhangzhouensis]TDY44294.1 uncharacterized protein DUF5077 [Algoriphagus zhangzhouensis]SHO64515.1 protein of unknown function [Algoriphagus zhangzhouensis]